MEESITINIKNYKSIKSSHISFEKGINVLTGLNGSGKTQLLEAIYTIINQSSDENEFGHVRYSNDDRVKKVIYRPSVRNILSKNHNEYGKFIGLDSLDDGKLSKEVRIQQRFEQLHGILLNIYVSSIIIENNKIKSSKNKKINNPRLTSWEKICNCFYRIFNKDIIVNLNSYKGLKVTSRNDIDETINSGEENKILLNCFSTGELEILSLITDLVLERKEEGSSFNKEKVDLFLIDEIDAHINPNLQNKLINILVEEGLVQDKYIIVTTHSPIVLLNEHIKQRFIVDNKQTENQIERIDEDYNKLNDIILKLYGNDKMLVMNYRGLMNSSILKYLYDCLEQPEAKADAKKHDKQIDRIGSALSSDFRIVCDVGIGKGRTLVAFKNIQKLTKLEKYYMLDIDPNCESILNDVIKSLSLPKDKFIFIKDIKEIKEDVDLWIMANVVHELKTDFINMFNKIISKTKLGGEILIVEAAIIVGEYDFFLFYPESLEEIFCSSKKFLVNHQHTFTRSTEEQDGVPLYMTSIQVNQRNQITTDDFLRGIKKNQELDLEKIEELYKSQDKKIISEFWRVMNLTNSLIRERQIKCKK